MYKSLVSIASDLRVGDRVEVTWNFFWFLSDTDTLQVLEVLYPPHSVVPTVVCVSTTDNRIVHLQIEAADHKVKIKTANDFKRCGTVTKIHKGSTGLP